MRRILALSGKDRETFLQGLVTNDVRRAPVWAALLTPQGKYLADLAGLARYRLQVLGITHLYGNDSSARWCTVTQRSQFFSHRRDSAALGGSGRFAACIWRD